ncbi:MAG: ATP-binding protein [Ilumatobacteraceae bacterium]
MRWFDRGAVDSLRAEARAAADELAALRQRVALLEHVIEAIPSAVVVVNRDGAVVRRDPLVTLTSHEGALLDEAIESVARAALGGAADDRRVEIYGPPQRVFLLRGCPLIDGGALVVVDDISERARLDAVRTDFVANISHELKTPVGGLAVLADAIVDHDDVTVMRQLAERMVEEAHRASSTIDDLLELSRIELGGAAATEIVDMTVVVAEAVHRVAAAARQRGVRIVVHDIRAPKALGEPRQLVSALANLLDNAVKYSEVDREVVVEIDRRDEWVETTVTDTGVGIPAKDLDRIFERFYRVDRARSRDTGGTGLGLAIVRHVANNHGGEVTVHSREGEGSVFTMRIPVAGD